MPRAYSSDLERLLQKVDKCGPLPRQRPELGPCWMWLAGLMHGGYGRFKRNGSSVGAHLASYQLFVGQVGPGLHLDHLCHNGDALCRDDPTCAHRRCINPAHLEPVTPRTNILRGWTVTAANAQKTHCPAGHEYTAENTQQAPGGRRRCRRCVKAQKRDYWRRYRANGYERLRSKS